MYTFRISDSKAPLMSPYIIIEAKTARGAIKKHLETEGIHKPVIKKIGEGFNKRWFGVMKVVISEHRDGIMYKAGELAYYELF